MRPGPASLEDDLVAQGKAIRLHTQGRRSGQPRSVVVGFAEQPDGSLLIAAAADGSHWARNLEAAPDCVVERSGAQRPYRATRLDGAPRNAAVSALILRYGTPSERLGAGPAFRLQPVPYACEPGGHERPTGSTL